MNKRKKTCWVCKRILPKHIFSFAHQLIPHDFNLARKWALKATEMISKAYTINPIFFCGISRGRILAGLFYLLSANDIDTTEVFPTYRHRITQLDIEVRCGVPTVSCRTGYYTWLEAFPRLFPNITRLNKRLENRIVLEAERRKYYRRIENTKL